jgi:hypothetical protein
MMTCRLQHNLTHCQLGCRRRRIHYHWERWRRNGTLVLQARAQATQLASLLQLPRHRSAALVDPRVLGAAHEAHRELGTAREAHRELGTAPEPAGCQLRQHEAGHFAPANALLELAGVVWCCAAVSVHAPS